jgi:hypothetical protein
VLARAEHHVAGLDGPAVDDVIALDDADAEAGHVVIARLIEVRQDRRLAADQGAVRLHAAVADALDEIARQGRIVLRHRQVIEEHQRLAAGAKTVVDGHGDEVDADRVVLARERGDLELAADAVGAGDEHRMAIVASEQAGVVIEAEQAGEAAEAVEDARRVRAAQVGHHAGERLLVHVEVQAGGLVAQGLLFHAGILWRETTQANFGARSVSEGSSPRLRCGLRATAPGRRTRSGWLRQRIV